MFFELIKKETIIIFLKKDDLFVIPPVVNVIIGFGIGLQIRFYFVNALVCYFKFTEF
jgi:hypothetical protein